jgi:hypothetical protein
MVPSLSSSSTCSSSSTELPSPPAAERNPYANYEAVPRGMVKSLPVPVISQPVVASRRDSNPANLFSRLWRKQSQPSPMYPQPYPIQEAW